MQSENNIVSTPAPVDVSDTYDNFYEKREHGNLEYPVSVYLVDLYQSHTHSIRWHWHEEMEILIVTGGCVKVTTDDGDSILISGQGFILNQNILHSVHSVDGNDCTFYSLVFHPDFLFGHDNSHLRTQFLLPLQSFSVFKSMLLQEENEGHKTMLNLLNRVITVNLEKMFGCEIATKGYLCLFWAALLSYLPKADIPKQAHMPLDGQRVKQAMLYIRIHHAEPISLDDIADSISVSKSECCRCFKRTIQMTPFEYLMKYRIYEASRQILDNYDKDHSISDLALSVGFNNISYFNKLFKRYLDCTPTQYRERVAESAATAGKVPFAIPHL